MHIKMLSIPTPVNPPSVFRPLASQFSIQDIISSVAVNSFREIIHVSLENE